MTLSHEGHSGPILEERCGLLVILLVNRYASSSTTMLPTRVDAATGQILDRRAIVDELGDYLPYLVEAGRLLEKPGIQDWAMRHVTEGVARYQTEYGFFDTTQAFDCDGSSGLGFRSLLIIHNADTINGLVSTYLLTNSRQVRNMVERFFEGVEKYSYEDGAVPYLLFSPFGWRLPLGNTLAASYFAEEALVFYRLTGENRYRSLAERLLTYHIQSEYFRNFGLFNLRQHRSAFLRPVLEAAFTIRGKPSSDSSVIVKDNCYLVFALLALYRFTGNKEARLVVERWLENLIAKVVNQDGSVVERWSPRSESATRADLQHSHSVIEVTLEIAQVLHDPTALTLAEHMAKYWLGHRGATGLVHEAGEDHRAHLDPQVDFAIDLLKLSELTGKEEYRTDGIELMEAVVERFYLPFGYAWTVDSMTGYCLESRIETKYLGLLIKGMVVASQVAAGKRIFGDEALRNLARDR